VHRSPWPLVSIALASVAAGPIFLAATMLAMLYLQLPWAVPVVPAAILQIALLAIPAAIGGFILSILPNMIGSSLMLVVGRAFPATRAPAAWVATGALLGAALAWLTGAFAAPAYAFGLILTSACCAAICRHSASWD
jgi:hypothetical protein